MADFRNAQRIAHWDGSKFFGFQGTSDADNDGGLFVRVHDGTTMLPTSVEGVTAKTAGLQIQLDTGTTAINAQANGAGDLKVTLDSESVAVTGTVATGAEHTEDDPSAGVETGNLLLAVRDDAGGNRVSADGDFAALTVDSMGRLRVLTSGSGGGTSAIDNAAFAVTTDSLTPTGYLVDETATDTVTEGNVGVPRMTTNRIALSTIADPTTPANRWAIDGAGLGQVDLAAVSVTAVPVSADSALNAVGNPIFVSNVAAVSSGEVHDYDTEVAVVKDASGDHDYAVTAAKTLLLESVIVSASGAGRPGWGEWGGERKDSRPHGTRTRRFVMASHPPPSLAVIRKRLTSLILAVLVAAFALPVGIADADTTVRRSSHHFKSNIKHRNSQFRIRAGTDISPVIGLRFASD
jgi:hypothetical protein